MSTAGGGAQNPSILRDRRVARVLDRDIAPIWNDRFARMIFRNLPQRNGLFVLDLHCGPGHSTAEILQRLDDTSRVLAIEPDETLVEIAKTRVRAEWRNRVYFKAGNFDDVTSMAASTYDLVVANLVLGEGVELAPALGELMRVTKPGGHILATLPLAGTWDEVEDIFAEVLRDAGLTQAVRRLERLRSLRPPPPLLGETLRQLGIGRDHFVIEHERLQMIFPSGREFLFAPVVEHGPLRLWKAIIGNDGSPQELFWRLKESIDTYYAGHVLAVTVVAGLVHIRIPDNSPGLSLAARYWAHYPGLDQLWGGLAGHISGKRQALPFSETDVDDFDLDIDMDFGGDAGGDDAEDEVAAAPAPEPEPEPAPALQPFSFTDSYEAPRRAPAPRRPAPVEDDVGDDAALAAPQPDDAPSYPVEDDDSSAYHAQPDDDAATDEAYQAPEDDEAAYQAPEDDEAAYQAPVDDEAAYQAPEDDEAAYQAPTDDDAMAADDVSYRAAEDDVAPAYTEDDQASTDDEIVGAPTDDVDAAEDDLRAAPTDDASEGAVGVPADDEAVGVPEDDASEDERATASEAEALRSDHDVEAAPTSDAAASDAALSDEASSDEASSAAAEIDASSDEATSDAASSDEATSDEATSDAATSDAAASDEASSDEASSDAASSDAAATSDEVASDAAASEPAAQDHVPAKEPATEAAEAPAEASEPAEGETAGDDGGKPLGLPLGRRPLGLPKIGERKSTLPTFRAPSFAPPKPNSGRDEATATASAAAETPAPADRPGPALPRFGLNFPKPPSPTREPDPATTQASSPVTTQASSPVTTQASSPVTTQASSPATTQASSPATTQAPVEAPSPGESVEEEIVDDVELLDDAEPIEDDKPPPPPPPPRPTFKPRPLLPIVAPEKKPK